VSRATVAARRAWNAGLVQRTAFGFASALGLAACGSHELDLDVHVASDQISVFVREPAGCTCDDPARFLEASTCRTSTDNPDPCSCDPAHAGCMTSVRVEVGGAILAEQPWREEDPWNGASIGVALAGLDPAAELVASGCGTEARVPIGQLPRPHATIASVAPDGADLVVGWTTEPPGTAVLVAVSEAYTRECHVDGAASYRFAGWGDNAYDTVRVSAVAGPATFSTPLGEVRAWSGTGEAQRP
jgi:hypothetical protein